MADEDDDLGLDNEPTERDILMQRARLMGIEFSNNIGTETLRKRISDKLEGEASASTEEGGDDAGSDGEAEEQPNAFEIMEADALEKQSIDPAVLSAVQVDPPIIVPARSEADIEAEIEARVQARLAAAPAPAMETTAFVVAPAPAPAPKLSKKEALRRAANRMVRCRIQVLDPKKASLPGEVMTVANETIGTIRRFIPFGEQTDDGWHIPQALYDYMVDRKFLHISTRTDKRTGQIHQETKWVREFAIEVLEPLTEADLARLGSAQLAAGVIVTGNGDLTN